MNDIKETYFLKNMVCNCCKILLTEKLSNAGVHVNEIKLGEITVSYDPEKIIKTEITELISSLGFEIIKNRDQIIVEKIKHAVIELIHELNNIDSIIRKSDYLVDKLGMNYQYISKLFSQNEPYTLEKYIILQKIERIKELVDAGDLTLSEIAYIMDYSSVHHMSAQFKNVTGYTLSEYKKSDHSSRIAIDEI
jgi:YesN/AraC family two-component response regulator